jgi:hypothetical protein
MNVGRSHISIHSPILSGLNSENAAAIGDQDQVRVIRGEM